MLKTIDFLRHKTEKKYILSFSYGMDSQISFQNYIG